MTCTIGRIRDEPVPARPPSRCGALTWRAVPQAAAALQAALSVFGQLLRHRLLRLVATLRVVVFALVPVCTFL